MRYAVLSLVLCFLIGCNNSPIRLDDPKNPWPNEPKEEKEMVEQKLEKIQEIIRVFGWKKGDGCFWYVISYLGESKEVKHIDVPEYRTKVFLIDKNTTPYCNIINVSYWEYKTLDVVKDSSFRHEKQKYIEKTYTRTRNFHHSYELYIHSMDEIKIK